MRFVSCILTGRAFRPPEPPQPPLNTKHAVAPGASIAQDSGCGRPSADCIDCRRHAGEVQRKVRGVHVQAVPAVMEGAAQGIASFQELMLDAELLEPVARREAGLACAE